MMLFAILAGEVSRAAGQGDSTIIRNGVISAVGETSSVAIDIGPCEPDETQRIEVKLRNETGMSFSTKTVHVGCACLKATLSTKIVQANEACVLDLSFSVPSRLDSNVGRQFLRIADDQGRTITQIEIVYSIRGLMCFKKESIHREVGMSQTMVEWSVPMLISNPVKRESITLKCDGGLESATGRVVDSENGPVATFKFLIDQDVEFPVVGSLIAEDKVVGRISKTTMFLSREGPVVVQPSMAIFKQQEKRWIATLMVRDNREGDPKDDLVISFRGVDGRTATVESRKIGKKVYKCSVNLPVEKSDTLRELFSGGLDCQISWSGGIHETRIPSIRGTE
jgi:hypothetical protein